MSVKALILVAMIATALAQFTSVTSYSSFGSVDYMAPSYKSVVRTYTYSPQNYAIIDS